MSETLWEQGLANSYLEERRLPDVELRDLAHCERGEAPSSDFEQVRHAELRVRRAARAVIGGTPEVAEHVLRVLHELEDLVVRPGRRRRARG